MSAIFHDLIISCPNEGGLFHASQGKAYRLDVRGTTGIAVSDKYLLRGVQPNGIEIYDNAGTCIKRHSELFEDVHDLLIHQDNFYVVSTDTNSIIQMNTQGDILRKTQISQERDSFHINCLTFWNHEIVFSAFGEFKEYRGYKGRTEESGFVQGLESGKKWAVGLSQPHSLLVFNENLILANSEYKEILEISPHGKIERKKSLDGYTRGLCIKDNILFVGISKTRNITTDQINSAYVVALHADTWDEMDRLEVDANEIYQIFSIADCQDKSSFLSRIAQEGLLSLRKDADELKKLHQASSQENEGLNKKITETCQWADGLKKNIEDRDDIIRSLNAKLDDMTSWGLSISKDVEDRDKEINRIHQLLKEQSGWNVRLNEELSQLKGLDNRDDTIKSLTAQLDDAMAWRKATLKDLDDRHETIKSLTGQLDDTMAWRKSMLKDIENRGAEIHKANQMLEEQLSRNAHLCDELSNKNEALSRIAIEVIECKEKIDDVSEKNTRLSSALVDRNLKIAQLESKCNEAILLMSEAENRNSTLEEKISGVEREFERLLAAKMDLEDHLSTAKNELNHSIATIREISDQLEVANDENAKSNQKLDAYRAEVDFLKQQIIAINGNNANAIEGFQKEINALKYELESTRARLFQISDWAQAISAGPMTYAAKKYALNVARFAWRKLPIRPNSKEKLRVFLKQRRRSVHTAEQSGLPVGLVHAGKSQLATSGYQSLPRDVFVFAVIDWHFRIQRPQHLARSLAKSGRRVFYFSNHFVDDPEPGYEMERLDPHCDIYQIKLHVQGAPAIYFAPPTAEAQAMLEQSMAVFLSDHDCFGSVSILQHAYWHSLAQKLPNNIKIYDCMDHHEGFGNVPHELIDMEKKVVAQSDLVIVTSGWLADAMESSNRNTLIIRNACEYTHFSKRPEHVYRDSGNRKIIGYYGAIAEWFDVDLIRKIARRFKDCLILMVGADTAGVQHQLKGLKNVIFTGEVAYGELPFYLYAFDVCLLPFKVIPLTLATNPVKVYEYLSGGKPVVCVDLPEMTQFGNLVYKASGHDQYLEMLKDALSDSANDPSLIATRKRFASGQTWDHRAELISGALGDVKLPKVSIVVLTYNNLELTKACLHSIYEYSNYPNMEVIVVDNASSDETPAFLKEFSHQNSNARIILNGKNLGFSAGNNVGLKAATGDYLVLLNNDTYVTPGWIMTLMNHLRSDNSIGIIGPVTNNIGNEARIDIAYDSMESMIDQARSYTLSRIGQHFPIKTVAFFCVMFPKATLDEVGFMDEKFQRGFFEDDDYCRRVESTGKRIVCAEDVFVHHHLSASFNQLGQEVKAKLFEENKAYYESKWGTWIPHKYRA